MTYGLDGDDDIMAVFSVLDATTYWTLLFFSPISCASPCNIPQAGGHELADRPWRQWPLLCMSLPTLPLLAPCEQTSNIYVRMKILYGRRVGKRAWPFLPFNWGRRDIEHYICVYVAYVNQAASLSLIGMYVAESNS